MPTLCRGLERFKRLVGMNRTRSKAVHEQPVILTRAPGPPPKLGQPLHILVCQEIGRRLRCVLGVEPASVYGLYHPKASAVPVYRAPAKGKQLAYANAADTNQPHHCTVGFREFVKRRGSWHWFSLKKLYQCPPRVRVTLSLRPCYPLAFQFICEVHLMRSAQLAILFLLCAAASPTQQLSVSHFDGNSWWAHVKYLADDSLEGRDTGSEGLRKAQAYAVEQIQKAGLEPAGTNGFYQPIRFNQYEVDEAKSSLALVTGNQPQPLSFADDAFISTRATRVSVNLTARMVFIGYGLKIPEKNLDELADLDLNGKIVVYLAGSPSDIPTALASHYQTAGERWKFLRAAGAIGMVSIFNPASMDIPWSRISVNRNHPSMDLADPEFNDTPGLQLGVSFNPASAEKLFAGSGHNFAEIAALGKDRKPLPHFVMATSLEANAVIQTKALESANIAAKLTGSDPALKNEFVVLSAHIDHVGIGAPINGDRIYNGAMDDGSGSALVMDIAASLKAHPEKLQRSILFLLVTAEEKGLLGSKYFAAHPTVAPKSIVADVNVDMFLPIVPLRILKIEGIEESDLGTRAATIAQSMGIKPIPDPEPLRNAFIRSDQYSFIKKGVPSVKVDVGFELGTPEQKVFKDWLTNRYHAPSDDVNQPVDLQSAASYEEFTRRLLLDTANTPARPRWKPDSFFRRYAAD
jgi:Zn-dependent M28 family amino/carboxypeptidase